MDSEVHKDTQPGRVEPKSANSSDAASAGTDVDKKIVQNVVNSVAKDLSAGTSSTVVDKKIVQTVANPAGELNW